MPLTAEAPNADAAPARSKAITVNSDLFLALQLRAAETGQTVEDYVDESIRLNLQDRLEELEDLRICDEREDEETISFDEMVTGLNLDGKLRH